ncbi:hypothetical protein DOTSEDRAFT_170027 [Dothistroma septosporum NZE10]|uniref:Dynactin subunit 6 n=1 Tax=Dothistroma septosporum (strain NZE10 / CBS 128990) TaxID=675120 RepID=N1PNE7_DOTSN|nr:hypothetical protein DOTSEDRAFT_170027 [Dothistroma septosporum NZE10]
MTSKPSASSRRTTTEPVPRPPCTIHSLAVIAEKAQLMGTHPVEIGENTVLHPYAKIKAEGGKISIGDNCIICEEAVIGFAGPRSVESTEGIPVSIGDGVVIEANAVVEARSVGNGTTIEVGAKIGRGARIGKFCKITPMSVIRPGEELEDYTVVFGDNQRRIDRTAKEHEEIRAAKWKGHVMHVELLKQLIPDASANWR